MPTTMYLSKQAQETAGAENERVRITVPLGKRVDQTGSPGAPVCGDLVMLVRAGKPIESYATVTRVLSGECSPGRYLVKTSDGRVRAITRGSDRHGAPWVSL